MPKVLVVDDEKAQRGVIASYLATRGWDVLLAGGGKEALRLAIESKPDAVVMDIRMPDLDGRTAFRELHQLEPTLPVILMTAYGEIRDAVDLIKEGVNNYLTKPIDLRKLLTLLEEAIGESVRPNVHAEIPDLPPGIVAESPAFRQTLGEVALVAPTDATCLLTGESGSGKEVLAELIHRWNGRAGGPLVRVNVAALPHSLVERELFGHIKGAFTGAIGNQIGHIEAASGGTLFLDEIGELPTAVQANLLRALETKEFYPVGDSKRRRSDFRLVVATNRDLEEAIRNGTFREDLYYRINVFRIHVPPLRDRPGDILPLVRTFLSTRERGSSVRLSPSAATALENFAWPGNVRELRNVVERAFILARGDVILPEHLPERLQSSQETRNEPSLMRPLEETQRLAIFQALRECGGNKTHAAKVLGISRRTLLNRLKAYGVGSENEDT